MDNRFSFSGKVYHWTVPRQSEESKLTSIAKQYGEPLSKTKVEAGEATLYAMEHKGNVMTYICVVPDDSV